MTQKEIISKVRVLIEYYGSYRGTIDIKSAMRLRLLFQHRE